MAQPGPLLRQPTVCSRSPCSNHMRAHGASAGLGALPACRLTAALGTAYRRVALQLSLQSSTAGAASTGRSTSCSAWGGLRRRPPIATAAAAADGSSPPPSGSRRALFSASPSASAAPAPAAAGGGDGLDAAPLLEAARSHWPQLRGQPDWVAEAALLLLLSCGKGSTTLPTNSLGSCLRNTGATGLPAQSAAVQLETAAPQVFSRHLTSNAAPLHDIVMLQLPSDELSEELAALGGRYAALDRARWLARCSQSAGREVTWDGLRRAVSGNLVGTVTEEDRLLATVLALYLLSRPERMCDAGSLLQTGLGGVGIFWWYGLWRTASSWTALKAWLQAHAVRAFDITKEAGRGQPVQLSRAVVDALPAASTPLPAAAPAALTDACGYSSGGGGGGSTTPPPAPPPLPPTQLFLQQWRRAPHLLSYGTSPDPYRNYLEPGIDTLRGAAARAVAAEGEDTAKPPAFRPPSPRPSAAAANDPFVRSLMGLLPESLHPHLELYAGQAKLSETAMSDAAAAACGGGDDEAAEAEFGAALLVEVHLDEGRAPTLKVSSPSTYGCGGCGGGSGDGAQAGGSRSHTQRYRSSSVRVLRDCQASVTEAITRLELVTGRQEPSLQRTPAAPATAAATAPAGGGGTWLADQPYGSGSVYSSTDGEGGAAAAANSPPLLFQPPPLFGTDNRCCVPGSLHRISAMRDNAGRVYGLTYRVGRHTRGDALLLADMLAGLATGEHRVVAAAPAAAAGGGGGGGADGVEGPAATLQPLEAAGSLLLVGRPGSGKTTVLRDVARLLADELDRRVVVVDTSNEVAGDDRTPHPCIGGARRMMVPRRELLWRVMLEAVQNHGPEVLVVDEISTEEEVMAARSIAQRGVMLVATTHGPSLKALLRNHTLNPLLGGIEVVTIGDATARLSDSGSKTRLERKDMPTFVAVVEVKPGGRLLVHPDAAESVDLLLPTLTASTTGGIGGIGSSSSSRLRAAAASGAAGPVPPPTRALSSADAAAAAGRPEAVRAAHLAGLAAAAAAAPAGAADASSGGALPVRGSAEAAAGPHTQLRYFDGAGRIWVEFSTPEAALRAGVRLS